MKLILIPCAKADTLWLAEHNGNLGSDNQHVMLGDHKKIMCIPSSEFSEPITTSGPYRQRNIVQALRMWLQLIAANSENWITVRDALDEIPDVHTLALSYGRDLDELLSDK